MAGNGWNQPQELLVAACLNIITCSLAVVIDPAIVIHLFARDALPHLKEDIPAALFYVTNWVYIFREVPYFEAFGRPPLLQQL